MASQDKHKLLNRNTFTDVIILSFLTVLGAYGVLYCTAFIVSLSAVPTPYKPTKSPDPVLLTLHTSISQLKHISSLIRTLISESKDPLTVLDPLTTCDILLKSAVSDLNISANLLTKGPGDDDQVFTETLNVWITFAILKQEGCLAYMENKMGSQVGLRLQRFQQCTKNNIALLEKIRPLVSKHRIRVCLYDYICATI